MTDYTRYRVVLPAHEIARLKRKSGNRDDQAYWIAKTLKGRAPKGLKFCVVPWKCSDGSIAADFNRTGLPHD